jgi:sentrin-specific protease 8
MALVSFHESSLYREDLNGIKGGWLTSNAIDFCFAVLQHKKHKLGADVALLAPATMFLVSMASDAEEAEEMVTSFNLPHARLVLAPLNNQRNMVSGDGTHWSLLVYDRKTDQFSHYDSCGTTNRAVAVAAATRLRPWIKAGSAEVREPPDAPQQDNGRDCGVFVCLNADKILAGTSVNTTPREAAEERREIVKLALSLQNPK